MKRPLLCFIVTLCAISLARGDQGIRSLQQTLKDQGFYYGAVTGGRECRDDCGDSALSDRNGLQVTGEINEETSRSVNPSSNSVASHRNRLQNLPPFNPTAFVLMRAHP